ncbi:MAG: folate-binding protein YgfZ [Pseudomonadota bacterium]
MNADWQSFLQQQQAHLQDGAVLDFGDIQGELLATRNSSVLCDLDQFGLLQVTGEDAQGFLQNLLSSDINEVNQRHAQISSMNNPKGRMLATMLIWRTGDDYLLHLPQSLVPVLHKRLSMYVLRSKVKIIPMGALRVSMGVSGADAATALQRQLGSIGQNRWEVTQHDDCSVIQLDAQRFLISATLQRAPSLWQSLAADLRPVGSGCWDWLNIRAGIPVITPPTQEQFVPQMANLELLGGVNFKKGCYPGQEIVARTQYLGKLKRRMYLAHLDSEVVPLAGDELFSSDLQDQASGMVVNAALAPGGGCDLLAVVHIESREHHAVHWKPQGPELQFLPLPYAIG